MGRGPRGGPVLVGGPSGRSGTNLETLGEVQEGLGDPRRGPRQVRGPSRRSGTDLETFGVVRDGLGR